MPVKLKTDFEIPEDTHTVLVIVPNYWGRSKTKEGALNNCKDRGGSPSKTGYLAYYFGSAFSTEDRPWVDQMGRVTWTYADEESMKARVQPVVEERVAPSRRA